MYNFKITKNRYFEIRHFDSFSLINTDFEPKCLNRLELIQTIKLLR